MSRTMTVQEALEACQQALGRNAPQEAEAIARQLVAATPPEATAPRFLLARALLAQGRADDAATLLAKVLAVEPGAAAARAALARALEDSGAATAAREAYHAALIANPADLRARWVGGRLLPRVYAAQAEVPAWRARFSAALHGLAAQRPRTPEQAEGALAGILLKTNFELAYQGEDDRPLQEAWGRLICHCVATRFPDLAAPPPPGAPVEGRPLRVGFASENFFSHTITLLFGHWVLKADRSRIEPHVYLVGGKRDSTSETLAKSAAGFRDLRGAAIEDAARAMRGDGLDVLIYPDLGMGARSMVLAGFRLAPLQCVSWGHPVTSGLPTIDLFLTSDAMEPDDGEAVYSERLVRLPRLGIYYAPTARTDGRRAAFGLPEDAVLYLCCQAQQKYLPQHDRLFAAIAARVPAARFVFIEHRSLTAVNRDFRRRLEDAFTAAGLAPERHLVFLPWQPWDDFLRLCAVADVFLDSIGWSGGNTTLEALAQGLPPVTLPGRFMRGRHTAAMLRLMAMDDLIARDEDDYVAIAARLGADPDHRAAVRTAVAERRGALYRDEGAVRALEDVLDREVRKAAAGAS